MPNATFRNAANFPCSWGGRSAYGGRGSAGRSGYDGLPTWVAVICATRATPLVFVVVINKREPKSQLVRPLFVNA